MRILFLSTENPFPVDHGHHIRTFHVLQALAEEHEVHFVGFTQNEDGFRYKQKLEEFCNTAAIFPLRFRGWRQLLMVLRNLFSTEPLIAQKYHDSDVVFYIQNLISEAGIQLIHFDMLHLAKYRKDFDALPAVLVNHNVESLRMLRWAKVESNPLLKLFLLYQYLKLKRFERQVCPEFDICTAVSEYDRQFLMEMCDGGRFEVIANGVDASYFSPSGSESTPNKMVWTGSMKSPYNRDAVDFFLNEIWEKIQQRHPEASMTFVGASPTQTLQQAAKKWNNIEFTGYVDDVRLHVAEASVFVAPMRAGSGTKIKVLNAMAQGKAVVTTTVGAEGIEAEADEEIIIADSAKVFAEKTVYLLQHPEVAKRIGKRARAVIEKKYDWDIIREKIRRLYREFEQSDKEVLLA